MSIVRTAWAAPTLRPFASADRVGCAHPTPLRIGRTAWAAPTLRPFALADRVGFAHPTPLRIGRRVGTAHAVRRLDTHRPLAGRL